MKTITVPLDFSNESLNGLNLSLMLANKTGANIQMVHVIEKKLHPYANQVVNYINRHKIPYTLEHLQGDNLTDITQDYSRTVNADLISIMTEQEKSISNLLLGSYAHQMINKAYVPVLSFPTYQLTKIREDFRTEGIYYS